ncbi:hypothetical protein [Kallotenue papyrolyticum]|uniref:hypothetical protein n=1 Tax=Kallotenue papyrolyticum TaxID=1325125 RepID=UPI0004786516|nr:hypothetical protein [Kallotenue papyrolyticum]
MHPENTPLYHQLLQDEHQLRAEYEAYLTRFFATHPYPQTQPLDLEGFRSALERWIREYHHAWQRNDQATMRELERLLAL